MIERLVGQLVLRDPPLALIEVGGVTYGVEMTEAALRALGASAVREDSPTGSEVPLAKVTIWTHQWVREDSLRLFGFPTRAERMLFSLLLTVNDVGPKVAMAIMGTLSMAELMAAVTAEDPAPLEEVPGIGAKKSRLILLMLKNRLPKLVILASPGVLGADSPASPSLAKSPAADASPTRDLFARSAASALAPSILTDLKSALANFGYKDKEIQPLLKRYERTPPAQELPALIRMALGELAGAASLPVNPAPTDEFF